MMIMGARGSWKHKNTAEKKREYFNSTNVTQLPLRQSMPTSADDNGHN